jgi:hypothetical protein
LTRREESLVAREKVKIFEKSLVKVSANLDAERVKARLLGKSISTR